MTVNERTLQLQLCFGTAEDPKGAVGGVAMGLPVAATRAVPKSRRNEQKAMLAMMEEVCRQLAVAFEKVASNKGAPGPDRQSI